MNQAPNVSERRQSAVNFWLFLAFFVGTACVIAFVTWGAGAFSPGAGRPGAVHKVLTTTR